MKKLTEEQIELIENRIAGISYKINLLRKRQDELRKRLEADNES